MKRTHSLALWLVSLCLSVWSGPLVAKAPPATQPDGDGGATVEFPKPGQDTRVLFIGNSYTYGNRLPQMVQALATAKRCRLKADMHTKGGASFGSHWQDEKAKAKLTGGDWDVVFLQDQSLMPVMAPADTIRHGTLWVEQVKKKQARAILFMTWARKGQPEMQKGLTATYCRLAKASGAEVAPVGLAWAKMIQDKPNIVLHAKDGSHPNLTGSYLAACVMFAAVYNVTPEGAPGTLSVPHDRTRRLVLCDVPGGIARYLQKVAWQTVSDFHKQGIEQVIKKLDEEDAKQPSSDGVKKFLESRTKPFGIRDAIAKWGQPHQKNEKQLLYLYTLQKGATLWLTFKDANALKQARILQKGARSVRVDISRQNADKRKE